MAIDTTLTTATGLERIGAPVPWHSPVSKPVCLDATVNFHYLGDHQASWVFGKNATLTRALRRKTTAQEIAGFTSPLTHAAYRRVHNAFDRTGIPNFCGDYADALHDYAVLDDYPTGIMASAYEAVINSIEHGSQYGKKGKVTITVNGGMKGMLFEIDDPGDGRAPIPLSVDDMVQRLDRAGTTPTSNVTTYKDMLTQEWKSEPAPLARGIGSVVFTLSKSLVNTEFLRPGYRVLVLYDRHTIPEWWRQEETPEQSPA